MYNRKQIFVCVHEEKAVVYEKQKMTNAVVISLLFV